MHSGPNHNAPLIPIELLRPRAISKQQVIIEILLLLHESPFGANGEHLNRPALQSIDNGPSVEVYIVDLHAPRLNFAHKLRVVLIGPRIIEGEEVLLSGRKLMREGPLDLIIPVDLPYQNGTMLVRLTL